MTNELELERMRAVLKDRRVTWTEKKMFGGNCFMVDDKMVFGTYKGGMMARVNPNAVPELLKKEGAGQMIHGGRPMTGYLLVSPNGYDLDKDLEFWVRKCLDFNPLAKSSRKK